MKLRSSLFIMSLVILISTIGWWWIQSSQADSDVNEINGNHRLMEGSISSFSPSIFWQCQRGLKKRFEASLVTSTQFHWRQDSNPSETKNWIFELTGQFEETCVEFRNSDGAWLVYLKVEPERLFQNVQEGPEAAELNQTLSTSLSEGIYVWRHLDKILEIATMTIPTNEMIELWRPFLLSRLSCPEMEPQSMTCPARIVDESMSLAVRQVDQENLMQLESSWEVNDVVNFQFTSSVRWTSDPRKPQVSDINFEMRRKEHRNIFDNDQHLRMTLTFDTAEHISKKERERLLNLYGQAQLIPSKSVTNTQAIDQASILKMSRQTLGDTTLNELWIPLKDDADQASRFLKIKAWARLNPDQISNLYETLDQGLFDDRLYRLWIQGIAQSGVKEGHKLLMDLVQGKVDQAQFVKYTLSSLAFSERPIEELDQLLKNLISKPEVPQESKKSAILTLGIVAGKTAGERSQDLGEYLWSLWSDQLPAEERLTIVQAIGNSGLSPAFSRLKQIAEFERDDRMAMEAVFAMRFMDNSFSWLKDQLNSKTTNSIFMGASRSIRYQILNEAQVKEILTQAFGISDSNRRHMVLTNLIQNQSLPQSSWSNFEIFLEKEEDPKIQDLLGQYLRRFQSR